VLSLGRPTSRLGRHDVGHEGVITGRDALSLRSSIADPRGVTQPPLQSTYLHGVRFIFLTQILMTGLKKKFLYKSNANHLTITKGFLYFSTGICTIFHLESKKQHAISFAGILFGQLQK